MALVSNIVNDLSTGTSVLTITKTGNPVETLTYENSLKTITFSLRPTINITGVEFLDLIKQINIFQTSILFNFNTNINVSIPFSNVTSNENHDSLDVFWNFTFTVGPNPRVANYSAENSTKTVDLLNRAQPKTIEFPEWIYFLSSLKHYQISFRNYFSI